MKKVLIVALVASTGLACAAWAGPKARAQKAGGAQGRGRALDPGVGMEKLVHNPEFAEEVGLTEEQITALGEAAYKHRKQMIELDAKRQLAGLEVDRLLQQADPDRDALNAAIEQRGHAETEIQKARVTQKLEVREILGDEAIVKIREHVRDEARKRREGRGQRRGPGPGQGQGAPGWRGWEMFGGGPKGGPEGAPPEDAPVEPGP